MCPKLKIILDIGIRLKEDLNNLPISHNQISTTKTTKYPSWQITRPSIRFDLNQHPMKINPPDMFKFYFKRSEYIVHESFSTVGSKQGENVSAAAIFNSDVY